MAGVVLRFTQYYCGLRKQDGLTCNSCIIATETVCRCFTANVKFQRSRYKSLVFRTSVEGTIVTCSCLAVILTFCFISVSCTNCCIWFSLGTYIWQMRSRHNFASADSARTARHGCNIAFVSKSAAIHCLLWCRRMCLLRMMYLNVQIITLRARSYSRRSSDILCPSLARKYCAYLQGML